MIYVKNNQGSTTINNCFLKRVIFIEWDSDGNSMGDELYTPMIIEGLQHVQHSYDHITTTSKGKDKL